MTATPQEETQEIPVCMWFAACTDPAPQQVRHPTLGWVDICNAHLAWLGDKPSPTQFIPPLAANVLARRGIQGSLAEHFSRQ